MLHPGDPSITGGPPAWHHALLVILIGLATGWPRGPLPYAAWVADATVLNLES